ncbi:hypothetical protein Tco_0153822 [Tanacetum coccineum]
MFRAFCTRSYSDGLFSFAKRSTSAPSCFPKPSDSIKNWADHFFWVDSYVFPISVPLYTGGILEKDSAPHLTARQGQTVKLLKSHKAHFRRYLECFLCLVGLSSYYPFEYLNGSEMGLFDFIKTADPRKVQAVEVQKRDDLVTLLESTRHCFMPLVIPATEGSSSAAAAEGTLGHALGRAVDFGMQEGLEASYEHGTAGRNLSVVDAYNPEAAKASYIDAVKAFEDVDFSLVNLLKSKKDAGMDELSILIYHEGDKTTVEETSLSFALMNVHARAAGARKHAAAFRQLMMEI